MIDVNNFFAILIGILSSFLLIILIILGIKLIGAITKVDRVIDDIEVKVKKMDSFFGLLDTLTDSLALVSDKITDSIVFVIRKFILRKRKEESDNNE